ncbi:MAG: DNA polymerase III subunit delta' [Desulfobulbaceae bacterium]|jgi:DNA polymerase-3 subunit delta'|nr:DNA polymerase III subunit delta' [Desulfobulbaceae bacterium]
MSFSAILGQTKALTLLSRAVGSGRLAHAYLFTGPDGVGKTTVALDLAAVLLCRRPQALLPCGSCPGCLKFQSSNHPDFLRIAPEGAAIKIDQIRNLKKALNFAPFESGQRIVLLEEVHTMRREAGNSLLKILEEPPANNLLILVGNATGAMLDTIVSRCQVIPFSPLPIQLAAEIIRGRKPDLDAAGSLALAALVDGCPGQALAIEADGILVLYHRLISEMVADRASPAVRVEKALALAAELAESKEGIEPLLALLRIFFKNVLAARTSVNCAPFVPEVMRARERWNVSQVSAKIAAIDLAEQALARNCNRGLTSEVLLLDFFDYGTPSS